MKKNIIFIALFFTFCMRIFLAAQEMNAEDVVEPSNFQIISLSNLNQTDLENFNSGEKPEIVLRCNEGDVFPFHFILGGKFLDLEKSKPQTIEILKTFFIRNDSGTFVFSNDFQSWGSFKDFFSGEVNYGIKETNGYTSSYLELILDKRDEYEVEE